MHKQLWDELCWEEHIFSTRNNRKRGVMKAKEMRARKKNNGRDAS